MKAYRVLLVVCVCILLVSCAETGGEETYSFDYKGRKICVGDNCRDTVDVIGEDFSYREEGISCGTGETSEIFSYSCFEIQSNRGIITRITLTNDFISTPEGVAVGTDRDRVTEVYGDDFESVGESIIYKKGNATLNFVIVDGTVGSVYYELAKN